MNNQHDEHQSDDGWTFEENKLFEDLMKDIELIEPLDSDSKNVIKEDESGPSNKRKTKKRPKARPISWTEEEHRLFLSGLERFGKGKWKDISNFYVKTKTPTQIASHAQKYINRLHCSTPIDKRRNSINDIRFVEGSNSSTYNQPSYISPQSSVPQNFGSPNVQNLAFNNISLEPSVLQNFVPPNFPHLAHNQAQQPHVFPNTNYWLW